jgi:hypothetical protein
MSSKCLLPGEAARMLTHLSENPLSDPSPEKLISHAEIMSGLRAIKENPSVSFEACRAVNQLYLQAEGPVMELVQAAGKSLEKQVAELVEVERAFFAAYGLPRAQTAISLTAIDLQSAINADAFTRGQESILGHPTSETAPQLNLGSLEILLQDQASEKLLPPIR